MIREREMAVGAVLLVEPLQREGEQRQCILGAARLDVGQKRIDEGIVDLELRALFRRGAAPVP